MKRYLLVAFLAMQGLMFSAFAQSPVGGIEWGTDGTTFPNPPEPRQPQPIVAGQVVQMSYKIPLQTPGTVVNYRTYTIVDGVTYYGPTNYFTMPTSTSGNLPAPVSSMPTNGQTGLDDRPDFAWSPVASATSYRIYVAKSAADIPTDPTVSDCPNCELNAIARDTTYIPPVSLLAGQTYFWSVKARSPTQYGQVSSTLPFSVASQPLLPAPTLDVPLSGTQVTSASAVLQWQSVSGATSYRILIATTPAALPTDPTIGDCAVCQVNTTTTASTFQFDLTGRPPGATYYWVVKARNAGQYGSYSAVRSFVSNSPASLFPAPALIGPTDGATGQSTRPTFSWSAVSGASSYRVMVAPTAAGLHTDPASADCPTCIVNAIVSNSGTSHIPDTGLLANGQTYYWSVKAYSPDYYGTWSAIRSFSTTSTQAVPTTIFQPYTVTLPNNSTQTINTYSPSGDLYGDVELRAGTLNLNGQTLTIHGNLIQSGGQLNVGGGKLVVMGDYRIQSYTSSSGLNRHRSSPGFAGEAVEV